VLDAVLLPLCAGGFWHGSTAGLAWGLIVLLITMTVLQILVQYRLNLWNLDFFNALEFRSGTEIWHQAQLLVLLAAVSIGLGRRFTFHRSWRRWVSRHLIGTWLGDELLTDFDRLRAGQP
jgi:putative ATP-binding cassette transporter